MSVEDILTITAIVIAMPLTVAVIVWWWSVHIENQCALGNHHPEEFEGACYCIYCGAEVK